MQLIEVRNDLLYILCPSVNIFSKFVHRLGLLSEDEVRIEPTPFDTLSGHLAKKLTFGKNSFNIFSFRNTLLYLPAV